MALFEYPIHEQIPGEIMSEIFIQYYGADGAPWMTKKISSICKAWRDIAFKTPELWTDIKLRVFYSITEATLNKAVTWLGRSKDRLCSITLLIADGADVVDDLLATLLLPFSARIYRLDVAVPYKAWHELASFMPLDMPMLQILKIKTPFVSFPPNVFLSSRQLRHIALDFRAGEGFYVSKPQTSLTMFPWENATQVLIRNISLPADAIYEAFCVSPNIKSYDLSFNGWQNLPQPFPAHICTDLTILRLSVPDNGLVGPFLSSLQLPALTVLEIRGHGRVSNEEIARTLLALHTAKPFNLTRLSLQDLWVLDKKPLLEFLELIPTLKSLALSNCGCIHEDLGLMLIKHDNKPVLLPSLQEAFFSEHGRCSITDETILDFLTSRVLQDFESAESDPTGPVAVLERFQFNDDRVIDPAIVEELEVLESAGLVLTLRRKHSIGEATEFEDDDE